MAKAPAKKAAGSKPAARIVEGTGVAVDSPDAARAETVESAMSAAIAKAMDDGVSDPAEIRKRMLAARDEVLRG